MKKQIRKAMLGTVAMMLMAIVTLTGVTYAWFSEANEANVTGLTMDVVASEGGVYISTDGYDLDSFTTSVALDAGNDKYSPVSTAGEYSTDGYLKFFSGTLEAPKDPTIKIKEVARGDKKGSYIEEDIYFDNSMGTAPITISLEGTLIVPKPATEGAATKPINLATRVAVVTRGSLLQSEILEGKTYDNTPVSLQIYENDAKTHTTQGILEYEKLDSEAGANEKFNTYALKATTTTAEDEAGGINRFAKSDTTHLQLMTTVSDAAAIEIVVPAGSYLKTTIYVWIEGQDADCQNDVSGQMFDAAIKFTLT